MFFIKTENTQIVGVTNMPHRDYPIQVDYEERFDFRKYDYFYNGGVITKQEKPQVSKKMLPTVQERIEALENAVTELAGEIYD